MAERVFDVLIIGTGQAAEPLAGKLIAAGRTVALAERSRVGGSCVNFGCTPTKAALASANLAHLARRAEEFGLKIPTVEVDFAAVLAKARELAEGSRQRQEKRLVEMTGATLVRGHARLRERRGERYVAEVGEETVLASAVVLNPGTRTAPPPAEGLDEIDCLHAGNWLDRPALPRRLILLGGGTIALEMGQFYRRMGSDVTIVEGFPRVAVQEDEDVSAALRDALEAEGVRFQMNTRINRAQRIESGVRLSCECSGEEVVVEGDEVFVATGRQPNTDDLGLDRVAVQVDEKGLVTVDERLRTSAPGVYAVGDVRGGPMFTQTAWDDHRIVAAHLLGGESHTIRERIVPYAMFVEPQLGRVGLTEQAAREAGKRFRVARFDMKSNAFAQEIRATTGFIKVLLEEGTDVVLGAAVFAAGGSEIVHLYADLMNAGTPYTVLRDAIIAHPTLAEAAQSAVEGIEG